MSQSPDPEPSPEPTPEPEPEPTPTPEPEPTPPPPIVPTTQESLAEQIQREHRELPDSQNPTDVVPNKPNIRPPEQPPTPPVEAEPA